MVLVLCLEDLYVYMDSTMHLDTFHKEVREALTSKEMNPDDERCHCKNSLVVLNHKILEANSQVQNVKLGGHQTCLSINRLWHELCDMLRRLVGTTAPGHHDCSIQE
ncbi:uncharacterized protein TNCV_3535251 [Trichonephila clavipes]|nr:uncharacterized protein TNCV_3535251 [Trichonephila clavipes]